MLYVLIEAERVRTQKLQKEDGLRTLESGNLSEDRAWEAERSDGEVLGQHSSKEPPMSSRPQTRDSDWFTLSPREMCASTFCEGFTCWSQILHRGSAVLSHGGGRLLVSQFG